ncbi:polysaccharide export protein [Rhodobacteraceae bacterium KMS-5]|uniref:Polysaccharide export protein n=2 Tax=Tabrizicola oligotrophica TaxID=2710650 RepID=A0A6M0QTB1_9RHOB|nr:polysaccharide export protein [Tabrizicola oligotrophica]
MPKTGLTMGPAIGLAVLLAACAAGPRGSGLQSEVLANSTAAGKSAVQDALPGEFAVEQITRNSLGRYANWPARAQGRTYAWPKGQGGLAKSVNAGDTISISVWVSEENGLITAPGQRVAELPPMTVSPSGQVFLPYVGQVKLAGLSQEEARAEIEAAYAKVAPSAQVQLRSVEGRQSSASVVSGVARPGSYPLSDSGVTVLDMLALSGGVPEAVANPQIRLQRGNTTYGISLDRVMKDTDLNVSVRGGDRMFVEADERYFLSLGAAGTRAQHHFPQDRVTALDAMSIIGGLAPTRADAQGILVLRAYDPGIVRADGSGPRHSRTIFTIDLTSADGLFSAGEFDIQPGDLIYVTESPLIGTRNALSLIGSVFGLAVNANKLNN